jgi:DNA-binding NtrC family response regulator
MATVARAPSDSAPVVDGRRPSIAVVDDDSGFAGYLRTFLALRGYDVRAYSRGDEIIAAIKQGEPPDIVLLDVAMPGMDGLQTLKALKTARPEMQVIMLSGREQAQTIVEAVRLGAADYVVKPGDPEGLGEIALDSAIKQAIERTRLVDELTSLRRQLSDDQDGATARPCARLHTSSSRLPIATSRFSSAARAASARSSSLAPSTSDRRERTSRSSR